MKTKEKPINYKKLEPHPLCLIFPAMSEEEYTTLKTGMKANGYDPKHPIVIMDGLILDGIHRYTAAKETRQEPQFIDFHKLNFKGTPIDYIVQENLGRRNLTPSQSAVLGAELAEKLEQEEEAEKKRLKEEAKASKSKKTSRAKSSPVKVPRPSNKVKQAAKIAGVSDTSVEKARALKKKDPDAFEKVKSGTTTLHGAATEAEKKQSKADREAGVLSTAMEVIDRTLGVDWAIVHTKNLTSKEIIAMSGLEADELLRIQPLIEVGWKLKLAMSYKSTQLTPGHPMREFLKRAIAQGGVFPWECTAEGATFDVEIRVRK